MFLLSNTIIFCSFILFLIVSFSTNSIAPIIIFLFFLIPYIFIYMKHIKEKKLSSTSSVEKNEYLNYQNYDEDSDLNDNKDDDEENVNLYNSENSTIENNVPYKLDDKIRYYTDIDYLTTNFSEIFYDVNNMSGVLVGNMRNRIKEDLNSLNIFIRQAQDMQIAVKPFFNLDINKIIFDLPNKNQGETDIYTYLHKVPLTKKGKIPKYAYELGFRTVEKVNTDIHCKDIKYFDTIFGIVYYLENQTIGKCSIHMKKGFDTYRIYLKLINNILSISKIEYHTINHQFVEVLYKAE